MLFSGKLQQAAALTLISCSPEVPSALAEEEWALWSIPSPQQDTQEAPKSGKFTQSHQGHLPPKCGVKFQGFGALGELCLPLGHAGPYGEADGQLAKGSSGDYIHTYPGAAA